MLGSKLGPRFIKTTYRMFLQDLNPNPCHAWPVHDLSLPNWAQVTEAEEKAQAGYVTSLDIQPSLHFRGNKIVIVASCAGCCMTLAEVTQASRQTY